MNIKPIFILSFASVMTLFGFRCMAQAQTELPAPDTAALAKQTQNPVSSLITLPFQFNFNSGGDLGDGTLFNLNFQPVIPFKLNDNWNMIARTIVPVLSIPGAEGTRFSGIGDMQEQIFISPSNPGKIIWGLGPQFSMSTATIALVQTGSWAAGPTFVALTMTGPWVVGVLVNNVWTFADSGSSTEVNQFLLQYFINYNFGKGWAISSAPSITSNWDATSGNKWTVPFGVGITRTTVLNGRPIKLGVSYYHNVKRPDGAAGNQVQLSVSLLYPKK